MTRWRGGGATAALAGLALGAGGLAHGAPAEAAPVTLEYAYNGTDGTDGSPQDFVVPEGVCRITVDAFGAAGGDDNFVAALQAGGGPGRATAELEVTPGETLEIRVGGGGGFIQSGDPSTGGVGGYNGGAPGGDGGDSQSGTGTAGSGGGGATDVRRAPYGPADRLLVAGGGGGSGFHDSDSVAFGGGGGGLAGDDGQDGGNIPEEPGGHGGTQTAGGAGGEPGGPQAAAGDPGAFALGGAGADAPDVAVGDPVHGGGGGGGGWYGGGGGGSSDGSSGSGGGGGGSGFGPPGTAFETNTPALAVEHGRLTLSYEPADGGCDTPPPPDVEPVAADPSFTG